MAGDIFSRSDKDAMAPATWTTDEQVEFLKEWLPKYLRHTEKKDYHHFWPSLYTAWFAKWPERAARFPGIEGLLTATQESELGQAVESRKIVGHQVVFVRGKLTTIL